MGANTIIGIDLGTSTTEAAVIRDGKPMMIVNFDGQVITPSAAGVDKEGQFVFGEKAKAQYLLAPEDTVIEAKRKIGTKETLRMGKKEYSPVEISAMLLKYVREYVSESLGEDISRAVISVPAYFDDLQRQETVEAGKRAGFLVERIINEPTAAALSYGISHMDEESHILVKLKEQAEWCKKELSVRDSCQIVIPFIAEKNGNPLALDETVTAEQFEEMTRELVERTHAPIDVVLADSGVLAAEIDRILLVGGSTRMPMIRRDIEAYLHTEPSKAVNPDYAVAEGAAIQAGIIEGTLSREDGIIMTDVNPYTLGIRVLCNDKSHYMSIVIPRNVTIPVVRKSVYYTSFDNQDAAKIEVYQGEHDDVRQNHFLGEFVISGIPMRPEGEERIEVEFSYNLNGMLEVSARIPSSGEEASVEINMMEYEQEFFTEAATDVTKWKESSLAKEYRTVIRRAERRLKNEKVQNMQFYKEDLESCLYDLKLALIEEDQDRAEELEEDILDMLEEME